MSHISEIRRRLLAYGAALFIAVIIAWHYSGALYACFTRPLTALMPPGHHLIATSVPTPFLVPLKLAFMTGFLITLPWLLFQIWSFIKPALYIHEKHWAWLFLLLGTALFYTGAAFAYFLTFPLVFQFFMGITPRGVDFTPDMAQYYDFAIQLILAFGFAFEIPVIIWGIIYSNLLDYQTLARARPYILVAAFITGMLLTPPDIISQIMLAVPMYALFELGLLMAKKSTPRLQKTR